jgi:uncharacterized membrane protein
LWCLLLVAAALHAAYYYPRLPAMMASHFDAQGNPDGWLPKESFFKMHAITFAGLSLFLLAMSFAVRVMPAWMVNVPRKDYWLAPERRGQSLAYVSRVLLWIGNATMLFLIATIDGVFRANLAAPVRMPVDFWIWLAGLLLFVVAVSIRLHLHFRLPKGSAGGSQGVDDQRRQGS